MSLSSCARVLASTICLAICAPAAATDPLTLTADSRLQGEGTGDSAGTACSMAGDLDGDGLDDLLLGAPNHDGAYTQGGKIYIVFGAPTGPHSLGASLASYDGLQNHDYAGLAVSIAPDVNGDGIDDAFIGAPGADIGGVAFVVFGRTVGWGVDVPLSDADAWFLAEGYHDGAGCALTGVGDVDGDGLGDLVVGASGDSSQGVISGAAYLITGAVAGTSSLAGATLKLVGEADNDWAGWTVAHAGDCDADGLGDFLISAPREDAGGLDAGAVYVYYGAGL